MSDTSTTHAHIAYELVDETEPKVVVIEFLSPTVADPNHARELGEQLRSLLRPDWPRQYVIDFKNVRSLGSTSFGEIAAFVRDVRHEGGQVQVCGLDPMVQLGATLIGLDDQAEFAPSRQAAIHACVELGQWAPSAV
ncbi:MAG TPA: STAS domain-containing protein [Isosphaeraceae bacterium]|nr:STAS domain-containing protein [Isosphaeraceae bacterium]